MILVPLPTIYVRKGSWIITVLAKVSHFAPGLKFKVLVNKQRAGGLSRTIKSYGILTLN